MKGAYNSGCLGWVVQQDEKSSESDAGKIPLCPLKQTGCLAIMWAVQKFQAYLYRKPFILEMNHQPLKCQQHWALLLQPLEFLVWVIPGHENVGTDYLSCAV